MKLISKENGDEYVEVAGHDTYRNTRGIAGAGLGLGIAGTALGLLNGGLGLCGRNGNAWGRGAAFGAEIATEKEDKCELISGMWQLAYNGALGRAADREKTYENFASLYREVIDNDFRNYKFSRDSFDVTAQKIADLDKKVAVLEAVRPYQDRIICGMIENVAERGKFDLFARTAYMINGQVVLPSTPTVTGYGSYNRCCPAATTTAPAA